MWLIAGCATPTDRARGFATAAGFEHRVLEGEGFNHWSQFRTGAARNRRLHVYIDHDGSPWLGGRQVAADPTPRDPLALRLMARDPGPALYLGRPCHFGVDDTARCNPLLWTHQRYGEHVVASMARAAQAFADARGFDELVLIGYSGGGTIAMLMAARLPRTVAVMTVAGNLDVDAWARLHDHSPLAGSLNPAALPPLPAHIGQLHYVGADDRNVPAGLVRTYASGVPWARVVEVKGFDHRCCWEAAWPRLLCGVPSRTANADVGCVP